MVRRLARAAHIVFVAAAVGMPLMAAAQDNEPPLADALMPGRSETLIDAARQAYESNPALLAGETDSRAAGEVSAQAKAQFGPSLSVSGSYGYTHERIVTPRFTGSVSGWGLSYDFSVNQPLFTSGRLTGQLNRARANEDIARVQARTAEITLLSNVIRAYAAVLRDDHLVGFAQENLRLLTGQLTETNARYKARYATATDLNQTETRLNFSRAQLELAQGNLQSSRNFYRNLVGHYPGMLAAMPSLPGLPAQVESAQDLAHLNNPNLQVSVLTERASRAAIAIARAEAGPTVSLVGSLGQNPYSIIDRSGRTVTTSGSVRVTMPLYASGQITARIREQVLRNDADNLRVEQQSRDVREAVATAWDQLSATRRSIPDYREAVTAAQHAFEGAQKQETAGQITSLDVLVTAQDLLNAQTAEAQAEAQLYIQHANLLAGMGTLDINALDPTVKPRNLGAYGPTWFAGLPSAPVVRPVDTLLYNDRPRHQPVQVEMDNEAGHPMSPEPEVGVSAPIR